MDGTSIIDVQDRLEHFMQRAARLHRSCFSTCYLQAMLGSPWMQSGEKISARHLRHLGLVFLVQSRT